jgi:hypothetical protein
MTAVKRKRWPWYVLGIIGILILLYLTGPKEPRPDFSALAIPAFTSGLKALEDSIASKESSLALKPDNQARIVWATPYQKTAYSMVYLHGNGASQEEGDPIRASIWMQPVPGTP